MKTPRHEVIIRFKDHYLILLPTLRAIAAMECHFGLSVANLLRILCERGLTNEQCSYIVWISARAAGCSDSYAEIRSYVEQENATTLSTALEDFFFAALDAGSARPVVENDYFPWSDMQQLAFTALDLLPHEFWNLTFAEFKQMAFGFEEHEAFDTATLEILMKKHPDITAER
ncbi:MAG: phage tail assembly chaperone [Proteobacteria bacterium]|nr:phage tail assembly chaperone [Pseudomonadota bacterium]